MDDFFSLPETAVLPIERFCAGIRPDASGDLFWSCPCGFEVRMPLGAPKRDRTTATHKKHVHHKNCRGGGDAQITCLGVTRFSFLLGPVLHMNPLVGVVVGATLGSAMEEIVPCTKPPAL